MGTRGLLVVALLSPLVLVPVLPRLLGAMHADRPSTGAPSMGPPRAGTTSPRVTAAVVSGLDPNLPVYVGDSRRLVARSIDDTAAAAHDVALVALGRRLLGTPSRSLPAGSAPVERLVLDLTAVDALGYVEQLLALVNSRQVRTRTEAVDRFSDHVRRLRYGSGVVDRCARLEDPRLWALAAARRGYLVDLSPFLPGSRQRRLPLKELLQPGSAGTSIASRASCPVPGSASVTLADLPLEAVPAAAASLRSGDLFVLVGGAPDRQRAAIGLVDQDQGRLGALLVRPGRGVVREPDLLALARSRPGTIGIRFLRSVPNADGRPDR